MAISCKCPASGIWSPYAGDWKYSHAV